MQNNYDKILKDKLGGLQPDYNAGDWAAMEQLLDGGGDAAGGSAAPASGGSGFILPLIICLGATIVATSLGIFSMGQLGANNEILANEFNSSNNNNNLIENTETGIYNEIQENGNNVTLENSKTTENELVESVESDEDNVKKYKNENTHSSTGQLVANTGNGGNSSLKTNLSKNSNSLSKSKTINDSKSVKNSFKGSSTSGGSTTSSGSLGASKSTKVDAPTLNASGANKSNEKDEPSLSLTNGTSTSLTEKPSSNESFSADEPNPNEGFATDNSNSAVESANGSSDVSIPTGASSGLSNNLNNRSSVDEPQNNNLSNELKTTVILDDPTEKVARPSLNQAAKEAAIADSIESFNNANVITTDPPTVLPKKKVTHTLGIDAGISLSMLDNTGITRPGYSFGATYAAQVNKRVGLYTGLRLTNKAYHKHNVVCDGLNSYDCPGDYSASITSIEVPLGIRVYAINNSARKMKLYFNAGVSMHTVLSEQFMYNNLDASEGILPVPPLPTTLTPPPSNTAYDGTSVIASTHSVSSLGVQEVYTDEFSITPYNRFYWDYHLSAGVEFDINPRWGMQVEPGVNISTRTVGFQEKRLFTPNVMARFNYTFGRKKNKDLARG